MRRFDHLSQLEVRLGQEIADFGQLRIPGSQVEEQALIQILRVPEIAVAEGLGGARKVLFGRGTARHARAGVTRGHHDDGTHQGNSQTGHQPHGFGGLVESAARPSALIFACVFTVIVSPGEPPASACW